MNTVTAVGYYIFKTEVKGEHIGRVERFANFLLTPARYLLDGKKIDWVQQDNQNLICRFIPSFEPEEKHPLKTLAMIVAIFPGALIGGSLKGLCVLGFHKFEIIRSIRTSIKRQEIAERPKNTFSRGQDKSFPQRFVALTKTLSNICDDLSKHISNDPSVILLSEVTCLKLTYAPETDQNPILDNISLLWNLRELYLSLGERNLTPAAITALKKINPKVSVLDAKLNWGKQIPFNQWITTTG